MYNFPLLLTQLGNRLLEECDKLPSCKGQSKKYFKAFAIFHARLKEIKIIYNIYLK